MIPLSLESDATILIVDDLPITIGPIAEALEEAGYRVLVAEDGEEAIKRARLAHPELILLDVMIPGVDGLQVCEQLKTDIQTADIPVIFMTGMGNPAGLIRGFEAGAVDYVTKPLRIDETIARITTHVRMRQMQKRLETQNAELRNYREHLEELVDKRTEMLDESNRQLREKIEEHRLANHELHIKEALLRSLIDSIPDLIFFKNTKSVYMGFNKAFAEYCGLDEAELVGKTDHAFAPAALADSFQENDRTMLMNGISQRNEEEVVYPDGRRVLLDTLKTPLRAADGQIVGVIGISRDITQRKQMENELAKREREYRTLAENSPNAIVRYDQNFRRIYFNEAYVAFSGLSAKDLIGKTPEERWWTLVPSAPEYTGFLKQVFETGQSVEIASEFMGEGGELHYGVVYLIPEHDHEGGVTNVISIGHDITGLKRMEAMLRKSESNFRTLAENSPDMIVRYDTACRRVFINPAYERYTGVQIEKAWNKSPNEIWVPLMSKNEYMERLRRVMQTGKPDQILLEWYLPDGTLTSHMMHTVAEYDERGSPIGALVIGHNISELKATERSLQESREQLRALTARLERSRELERKRIAREIHDELGQLLSVLRLNVTTLDFLFGNENLELHKKTNTMVNTVDRAIAIVRDLATQLRPAVLSTGLVSALEWLVNEFSENTGLTIHLKVSGDEVSLDESRSMLVFRIVQESLTNTLRHSGADSIQVDISCLDGTCSVTVTDNGVGFDPSSEGNIKSLGLVGMRERALMLGGRLIIDSEKNHGTTIKLSIPLSTQPLPFN